MSSSTSATKGGAATVWKMPNLKGEASNQGTPPLHTAEELDSISSTARDEGFRNGYEEGMAAGLAHADVLITRTKGILENFARPLAALDDEIEQELLQLTLSLCERILRKTLPQEPESIAAFIREGIELLQPADRQVSIYVNNEDASALTELLGNAGEGWRILPDRVLKPGDIRIQTDSGALDGALLTRLESMLRDLMEAA